MRQDQDSFIFIIEKTPLVSIDLVIRNEKGQILLGFRRNRPAQGCWFVPGGRIRKNERLQDALVRIAEAETGITPSHGTLLGAFDHLYEDNAFAIPGLGTHYVVLAYQLDIDSSTPLVGDDQHATLQWWDTETLLASADVHENTKLYFIDTADNGFRCPRC